MAEGARQSRGGCGLDAVSLDEFETNLMLNLRELSRSLSGGSYQPMPARFVTIAKENGKERELGILAVRDRVAQRAVLDAIEPLVEPLLLDCSFAFRQGRNVEMAVQHMIAARANGDKNFCLMQARDCRGQDQKLYGIRAATGGGGSRRARHASFEKIAGERATCRIG